MTPPTRWERRSRSDRWLIAGAIVAAFAGYIALAWANGWFSP